MLLFSPIQENSQPLSIIGYRPCHWGILALLEISVSRTSPHPQSPPELTPSRKKFLPSHLVTGEEKRGRHPHCPPGETRVEFCDILMLSHGKLYYHRCRQGDIQLRATSANVTLEVLCDMRISHGYRDAQKN